MASNTENNELPPISNANDTSNINAGHNVGIEDTVIVENTNYSSFDLGGSENKPLSRNDDDFEYQHLPKVCDI